VEQIKLATIYEVVEANLDLWPKYIDFMNSHQLMPQSEEIRVSSDFGAPLTITSAKTGDKRVTVRLVEQDNNMTKAVVAYHPELTLFSQRQVDFLTLTQKWAIETRADKAKGKGGGTGINRKLNDEIADREQAKKFASKGRIFEYLRQEGLKDMSDFGLPQVPINTFDTRYSVASLLDFFHPRNSRQDLDIYMRELPANESRDISELASGVYESVGRDFKLHGKQASLVLTARDFLAFIDHQKQWR